MQVGFFIALIYPYTTKDYTYTEMRLTVRREIAPFHNPIFTFTRTKSCSSRPIPHE